MNTQHFVARSSIPAPVSRLAAWHLRSGALDRLIPGWQDVRIIERPARLEDGARVVLELRAGPFRRRWIALHRGFDDAGFEDVQERGPFAHWEHAHRFLPGSEATRSTLEDEIHYVLPMGLPGRWIAGGSARRSLRRLFAYRHRLTLGDIARHEKYGPDRSFSVAISGATGLVGSALAAFLSCGGHRVLRLVRKPVPDDPESIHYDVESGRVEIEKLENVDAVVHLAGENIAARRWSPTQKARIRDSRVQGTRLIAETLAGMRNGPRTLVVASAIGYYGNRGDEILDESSSPGTGFLPEISRAWEAAAEPARGSGVRTTHLRIGIVIAAAGGVLGKLLLPFRFGLGGRVGNGRQYMSWIGLDDLIGVIHHALMEDTTRGVLNAVSPDPVTNAGFTRTLARVLRRPAVLPVPAPAIGIALGEMGRELLLGGARVLPHRLRQSDFEFRHPTLEQALRFELGLFEPDAKTDPRFESD